MLSLKQKKGSIKTLSVTQVWNQLCALGRERHHVEGRLRLLLHSKKYQGEFSAQVRVKEHEELLFEITDPFGSVLAKLEKHGKKTRYFEKTKGLLKRTPLPQHVWMGVPPAWLSTLLLGKMPCPQKMRFLKKSVTFQKGEIFYLEGRWGKDQNRFLWALKSHQTKFFPQELRWQKKVNHEWKAVFKIQFYCWNTFQNHARCLKIDSKRGRLKAKWRVFHVKEN